MTTTETTVKTAKAPKQPKQLLVDSCWVQLQLVEGQHEGKTIVRGEFAKCGIATENKRVYPGKLWEREFNRLRKTMSAGSLFGESDHPSDGRTQLSRVSHKITNLEIKDGVVVGEAEIMDTARGRDLKAILASGGKIGISSRGLGSVRTNERGEDIVQDDYRLVTFDFVADPADQDAFPGVFYEHREERMEQDQEAKQAQEFAAAVEQARKESREGAEAALREEFAKEMVTRLSAFRAEIAEQIRGELLSDPSVAGAKVALERVKDALRPFVLPEDAKIVGEQKDSEIGQLKKMLAEQSLRLKTLEEEKSNLEKVAKEAGYKFYLERQIGSDPDAELIRKLLGDVTVFKTGAELQEKIEAVRTDLQTKRAEAAKLTEEIEAEKRAERDRKEKERVRALKHEESLREEVAQLREALAKSYRVNQEFEVLYYAEERLRNHPRAAEIRPLVENSTLESKEQIDKILDGFRAAPLQSEEVANVRARVRQLTQGGHGPDAIEEAKPARPRSENGGFFERLGTTREEQRGLMGFAPTRTK